MEYPKPGTPIPAVDIEDLRLLWDYQRSLPPQTATGAGVIEQIVGDRKFNAGAASYRCAMLGLMQITLESIWTGGEISESALRQPHRCLWK